MRNQDNKKVDFFFFFKSTFLNSRKLGIKRKKKREFQNKVNCLGLNSVFKLKVLKVIVKIVRENDRKFKLKHNVYECFKK